MYCQACGSTNSDDASFCKACGVALSPYAPPRTTTWSEAQANTAFAGYAGFWKRFAAYLLDVVITMLIGGVLGFFWGLFYTMAIGGTGHESGNAIGGGVLGIVGAWLYYVLMESSARQATFCKQILGIVVTDLDGRRISFARANGRYFGKLISSLILGIGYIMVGTTAKKQGLHDIMAGCLVVNRD